MFEWRFLAGYEIAGGLWGFYVLATTLPVVGWRLLFTVGFAVLYSVLLYAGILVLQNHPAARRLSTIAQWVQAPYVLTAILGYSFYGPARFTVGLRIEDATLLSLFDIGAGYRFSAVPRLSDTTIGINLLPLFVLWYLYRSSTRKGASITSRGVVVR